MLCGKPLFLKTMFLFKNKIEGFFWDGCKCWRVDTVTTHWHSLVLLGQVGTRGIEGCMWHVLSVRPVEPQWCDGVAEVTSRLGQEKGMGQGGGEPLLLPPKLWGPPTSLSSNICLSFPSMGLFGPQPWILSSGIF